MIEKRNGFIELIRILLAYIIAVTHFSGSIPGANLGLEFFFMISGFYQMISMEKSNFSPFIYSISRFLKLIFIYETSILMLAFFGESSIDPGLFLRRLFISLPDMLCMQMTGIAHISINPELWYVSTMITAGLFLALLYKIYQHKFRYILPIISILCYSFLYKHYGNLEINHLVRDFFIPSGTIRGLANMSMGCMLYYTNNFIKDIKPSHTKTIVLSSFFIISIMICSVCFFIKPCTNYDFFIVFCAPTILLCALSGETVFSKPLNSIGNLLSTFLGKQYSFALVCYTAFTMISSPFIIPYHKFTPNIALIIFLVVLSFVSFVGAKLADKFNHRYINNLITSINI